MAFYLLTPVMTGPSSPSGSVSADSEAYPAFAQAYKAFDQQNTTDWAAGNTALSSPNPPHWIEYDFVTESKKVFRYRMILNKDDHPIDFKLQAWNGSSWIDLDTQTGLEVTGSFVYTSYFTISSPDYYQKYRLYVTDWHITVGVEDYFSVWELELEGDRTSVTVPVVDLGFQALPAAGVVGEYAVVPKADLGELTALAPSIKITPQPITVPVADLGTFTALAPAMAVNPRTDIPFSIIYKLTLTGAADATTDVVLPFSSYQARFRGNTPTFLSVVIPNGTDYADDITARPNGSLVLERGYRYQDGTEALVKIMVVPVDTVADQGGGRSRSITLSGSSVIGAPTPKTVVLQNASFRQAGTNGIRYRADLDFNLRPGDTAVVGAESITVGLITYIVSADTGEFMEVSENE